MHLNELFSLVQGLGGTSVVRTYIDQLAQVLSALVGWSSITYCGNRNCGGTKDDVNGNPHSSSGTCKYLDPVLPNKPCEDCGCMKWDVPGATEYDKGHHLGRRCKKCSGDKTDCQCNKSGGCSTGKECKCALAGKCCKCCCTSCSGKCNKECICDKEKKQGKENEGNTYDEEYRMHSYTSAYPYKSILIKDSYVESKRVDVKPYWHDLIDPRGFYPSSASERRHQCARILLGSVCLIWSGVTYMHWTGKYYKTSPYWNNHILDGSGLDDGTLSQWLQALGFPMSMLNNSGPQNRLDKVIWDGFMGQLFLGFTHPSGSNAQDGTTAKQPYDMNYAGFVHTAHRDSFNDQAHVFPKNDSSSSTGTVPDQHKIGAIFKLYILSCAYFTGLQKKSASLSSTTNTTPKTIREILYWLSALPYSQAYKDMLEYAKKELKKVAPRNTNGTETLSFYQTGRSHPITVHEFNLFAHFQAVTQYCPLVLIGIQGGIHSTKSTTPSINALYANTECHFTYPTVPIQAYNQVVHYIRALFYQLYFLRKQCAVKVACGGKWRECRYGSGVVSKGVISWMCLGCDPMEHDRKSRVDKVGAEILKGVKEDEKTIPGALKVILEKIGDVVVQLGNAQEALEGKDKEAIQGVKKKLQEAKKELDVAVKKDGLDVELKEAKKKLEALTNNGGSGILGELAGKLNGGDVTDPGKNKISEAIDGVRKVLGALKEGVEKQIKEVLDQAKSAVEQFTILTSVKDEIQLANVKEEAQYSAILSAIDQLTSICNTAKCTACGSHSTKCGQKGTPTMCKECGNMTTTGVPSPLQAFLEDRLPGFSCDVVRNDDKDQPDYPSAASHLGHCGGSGQCCPLPMGFRGNFYNGGISDMTGSRLYGLLYFFSNGDMMQSCVYTLVRVTAELSATTPQVLGDVFGFFRGGIGEKEQKDSKKCNHDKDPKESKNNGDYFCGWCASGLRDEVKHIGWIPNTDKAPYQETVGQALIAIKGDKDSGGKQTGTTSLSALTKNSEYVSPLTGELYTAVSATFGGTYLSWVLYLSDALEGGLQSLASAFKEIECRGCRDCDPNKCKKGSHGNKGGAQCQCQSIVSCTGVLPVLYRHGFSYGNPFNLEGYQQKDEKSGDYSITDKDNKTVKRCHEFLESLKKVLDDKKGTSKGQEQHPLSNLLSQVGKLQYDIRLPWIFVLTIAWLIAVLYLAFGAIWPLDWTYMRSHWLRGGAHQWQCMWYKVMTGRKVRVALEGVAFHITMT